MEYTLMDYICAFCCGIMAEMGNILGISYQLINVILFVIAEPLVVFILYIGLIWLAFDLPKNQFVWKWITRMAYVIGIITFLLIIASTVKIFLDWNEIVINPYVLLNLNEPSEWIRNTFTATVNWLVQMDKTLGVSYSTINVIVYIIAMPVIALGFFISGGLIMRKRREI